MDRETLLSPTEQQVPTQTESSLSSFKSSTSIQDWDNDTAVIPRLQVIDENQKFT